MTRVSKAFWIWCQFYENDMIFLNKIQSILSKNFISPFFDIHLTLHGPFLNKNDLFNDKFYELENNLKSIEIEALDYSISNDFYTSLFVDICKTNNLIQMVDYLKKKFFLQNQKNNFKPHISLIYGNFKKDNKINAIKNLPSIKRKKFRIKNLAIVDVNEKINKWNILKKVNLSN